MFMWSLILNINDQNLSISDSEINTIINDSSYYSILIKNHDWEISLGLNDINVSKSLWDISLGGYQYIWVNKNWNKNQWNDVINYIKIYEK